MTTEQLLIVLLFVLLPLIIFLVRVLGRRLERRTARKIEPEAPQTPQVRIPLPRVEKRRPPPAGLRGAPAPGVSPPAVTPRRAGPPVLGLGDARRGIVLMTVLGSCRALEPPGRLAPGPSGTGQRDPAR